LFAAVGCASTNSSTVSNDEYDDVAQNVGTATASPSGGDVHAMNNVVLIAGGTLPLGFSQSTEGMISGTFLGISYELSVTCRDAWNNTLPVCNGDTQLADLVVDWSGSLAVPNFSTMMDRHGDWSLMNVQHSSVKLAGTGSFSFDSSITSPSTSVTAAYHFDYDAAYMSVFIDKTTELATAGEIQYDITASKTVTGQPERIFAISADVTFDGDETATIALDNMHHYTLNLVTDVVIKID
jgi:hypothetical protein